MDQYDHLLAGGRCLNRRGASHSDLVHAFQLFTEAAQRGSAEAVEEVATMLALGRGVAKAPHAAFKYFMMAAEAGSSTAQARAADLLASGAGMDVDLDGALELYADGAGLGDANGLLGLARMRRDGRGGRVDLTAAASLYKQAARAGSWLGARELGELLLAAGNQAAAWVWFRKAETLGGGASAREKAEWLEYSLSPIEMEQARAAVDAGEM